MDPQWIISAIAIITVGVHILVRLRHPRVGPIRTASSQLSAAPEELDHHLVTDCDGHVAEAAKFVAIPLDRGRDKHLPDPRRPEEPDLRTGRHMPNRTHSRPEP